MKVIITEFTEKEYVEVKVVDASGSTLQRFTFNNKIEAKAFFSGFHCSQNIINGLVQSLPMTYEFLKA